MHGRSRQNLIIHFDDNSAPEFEPFEFFSRARQKLIVLLSKTALERDDPWQKAIKEMLRHEEKCKNQNCKENGWNELKIIDVEYIGITDDEVTRFENFIYDEPPESNIFQDIADIVSLAWDFDFFYLL